ncbi:19185_t:CDS:10 [Rhizophagus irregularis]|nr:19185_t:CDS:10 [Rhizophagus irregularis]
MDNRLKLKYPDYWNRAPNTWGTVNDWDLFWIKQSHLVTVNKRNSHSALANDLKCLKKIFDINNPAYKMACNLSSELKETQKPTGSTIACAWLLKRSWHTLCLIWQPKRVEKVFPIKRKNRQVAPLRVRGHKNAGRTSNIQNDQIWEKSDLVTSLKLESDIIDVELEIDRARLQKCADDEFDTIEQERKRIRTVVPPLRGTIYGRTINGGTNNMFISNKSDREKDLNNEIENFFQGHSERQSSNLFGKVEHDVSNETDNEKGEVIEPFPLIGNLNEVKRDESLQHAIEQEALFEDVKLQTPQKREQKKIKPNESDWESSMGWEFDEPEPTWLKKVINRQKFLISQMDPSARYESSLSPIWWRIIDASDLKSTSDFLTEADMSDLVAVFASALNVGHPTEDWTILEPSVERCLQALAKLDNNHLNKVGKIVPLEGFHGAILEIQKMVKNVETSSLSVSLFGDEDTNDKVKPTSSVEEEDYLNPDVQFILDLIRFTCEMLMKGIPQRKNSERDIDVFIKRHLFSCFDNILDSHFGEMVSRASRDRRAGAMDAPETAEGYHLDWMFTKHDLAKDLPYGREFSLCERTGSRIENERKILSNTLKAQKTLRDMHRTLVEAISVEGGGMLSKQVLRATTKLLMPGFLSHCFFIRAFLVVYIGDGFYSSVILADFDIPSTYSELGSIIKVSRIMLQVKKLLNLTVCRFKLMKERAFKEKFASGKVLMNAQSQEYRSPQKTKKKK